MREVNCQSMVGRIKSILLKSPRSAFVSQENIEEQWESLCFSGPPNLEKACSDFDQFVRHLRESDIEIVFLPADEETTLDAIYTHDPVVITASGAVLGNMGKEQRRSEPEKIADFFRQNEIPILGTISGSGRLEGGDVVWLDRRCVAIGEGYRTNHEGIRQFKELVGDSVDQVIAVPLPHWRGPQDVLHLQSMISLVDSNLAVVYSPLMPVPFRQMLIERQFDLIEVPEDEYATLGCNILAVAPRQAVIVDGNPGTTELLRQQGVQVRSFDGSEVCLKGAGGPTCLSRPLLRV